MPAATRNNAPRTQRGLVLCWFCARVREGGEAIVVGMLAYLYSINL